MKKSKNIRIFVSPLQVNFSTKTKEMQFVSIEDIEVKYKELTEINSFVGNMTNKDFVKWLRLGTIEDQKCVLTLLEKAELYEKCTICANVINNLYSQQNN